MRKTIAVQFEKASNLDAAEKVGVEALTDFLEPQMQHSVTGNLPITVVPRTTGVYARSKVKPQALHDQSGCEKSAGIGLYASNSRA
jgi:hypothetical protein